MAGLKSCSIDRKNRQLSSQFPACVAIVNPLPCNSKISQFGLRSLSDAMPGCPAAVRPGPCSLGEGPTEAPSVQHLALHKNFQDDLLHGVDSDMGSAGSGMDSMHQGVNSFVCSLLWTTHQKILGHQSRALDYPDVLLTLHERALSAAVTTSWILRLHPSLQAVELRCPWVYRSHYRQQQGASRKKHWAVS